MRRRSPAAAIGTEKTQVAASHQGAAVLDKADGEAAERVRPPPCISGNAIIEQHDGDIAITDAGEVCVEGAQDQL